MELRHGLHLAYCTNIHRGETWPEIQAALQRHTLRVRDRVCPAGERYAIGLRLSAQAARELYDPSARRAFRRWLDENDAYVFTINGFPYGNFHGRHVKEQVFQPDWGTPQRLEYTQALFEILADLIPDGVSGSVSTLPGSHKELLREPKADSEKTILTQLRSMAEWTARLADRRGLDLHLGVEPEPLGWFENTAETVDVFNRLGQSEAITRCLGVNYDTCHFAVEYEDAATSLSAFRDAGIRLSKLHLSNALRLQPTPSALRALAAFQEDVYFHQTIARMDDGQLRRHRDLPEALASALRGEPVGDEWRVHFHIPLHAPAHEPFGDTSDHLTDTLTFLGKNPTLCAHLEMETYTWEVLPPQLRSTTVEEQLEKEYAWTLAHLRAHQLA
jgi:sugar phosphate isomerase/epimerase